MAKPRSRRGAHFMKVAPAENRPESRPYVRGAAPALVLCPECETFQRPQHTCVPMPGDYRPDTNL